MIKILVPDESAAQADATPASERFVLPAIPDAVLERHGARVLRPSEAAVVQGAPPPSPTVYRYGVLLMPSDLMDESVLVMNAVLKDIGVRLVPPEPIGQDLREHAAFASMPRAVGIAPLNRFSDKPIDAWTVLQWLRTRPAALAMQAEDAAEEKRTELLQWVEVLQKVVPRIALEHLLVGSAVDGGGSAIIGANTASNGSPDLGDLFGRPTTGMSGRIPVTVALTEPGRPAIAENGHQPLPHPLRAG